MMIIKSESKHYNLKDILLSIDWKRVIKACRCFLFVFIKTSIEKKRFLSLSAQFMKVGLPMPEVFGLFLAVQDSSIGDIVSE